jgi:hypothetical protein
MDQDDMSVGWCLCCALIKYQDAVKGYAGVQRFESIDMLSFEEETCQSVPYGLWFQLTHLKNVDK